MIKSIYRFSLVGMLVFFLFVPKAFASINYLNEAHASGTNSATTIGIDTTAADLIVISATADNTICPTPTDSQNNTWTQLTSTTYPGGSYACNRMWYKISPATNSSHTFTLSSTGNAPRIQVMTFSGATGGFDVENGNTFNGTSFVTGNVTPSQDNELVITSAGQGANGPGFASINSGFTLLSTGGAYGMAYIIETTATAKNPTWTNTSFYFGATRIATFKQTTPIGRIIRFFGRMRLLGGTRIK